MSDDLPPPDAEPEVTGEGKESLAPLRTRLLGRMTRVVAWTVVVVTAAYAIDEVSGSNLLPPWRTLLPGGSTEPAPAREVSRQQVVAATRSLDRTLDALLAKPALGDPGASTTAFGPGTAPSSTTASGASAGAPVESGDATLAANLAAAPSGAGEDAVRPLEIPCLREDAGTCVEGAMDRFYAALRRTAQGEKGAVTRITHYGDSIIIEDLWTSTVRRRLQERFGDAGAGFLFLARPWEWYDRLDVVLKLTDAWHFYRVTIGHVHDDFYGYGGVSFVAGGPGAKATYETVVEGPVGRSVSRCEVYFLGQPGGGNVQVSVDGTSVETFSTDAPSVGAGFHLVRMPDGPHTIVVRSVGGGPVRLFGVTLERDGPGVVYDGIGLLGASARALLEPEEAHWKEQFAHRRPDLVVLTFGTNESDHQLSISGYREQLAKVVRRIRAVAPFASCLLAGPPDRGDLNTRETRSIIPKLIEAQREIALAEGCAFWDTFSAMGGKNTMWRWYRSGPRRAFGDLTHLAPAGGEILGDLLHAALLQGFIDYLSRSP
jgi:lysophospholipase L1-like esterase